MGRGNICSRLLHTNEYTPLSQYGGVAMLCFDQLAHRSGGSGSDERGLGRWTWMLFRGKNNVRTRIVSAYQPNSAKIQQLFWISI